jgi:DNA-binding FadR family transcriptional regulator
MGAQNSPDTRFRSIKGHWRIFECLSAKDQDGVKRAIREHLEDSKQDIKRIIFDFATSGAHLPPEKLRKE